MGAGMLPADSGAIVGKDSRREISAAQAPRKWHWNLSTFTFSLWHVIDDEFFQCLISILGIFPSSDITEIWRAYSHRNVFPALVQMTAVRRIVFENDFAKLVRSRRSSCSFWRHFFRVLVDLSESSEPNFCGQVSKLQFNTNRVEIRQRTTKEIAFAWGKVSLRAATGMPKASKRQRASASNGRQSQRTIWTRKFAGDREA